MLLQLLYTKNKNELKQAICQMENEKSPGIDGIPTEFYIKLLTKSLKMTYYKYYK